MCSGERQRCIGTDALAAAGVACLHIEGAFYWGIGWLLADAAGLALYKRLSGTK